MPEAVTIDPALAAAALVPLLFFDSPPWFSATPSPTPSAMTKNTVTAAATEKLGKPLELPRRPLRRPAAPAGSTDIAAATGSSAAALAPCGLAAASRSAASIRCATSSGMGTGGGERNVARIPRNAVSSAAHCAQPATCASTSLGLASPRSSPRSSPWSSPRSSMRAASSSSSGWGCSPEVLSWCGRRRLDAAGGWWVPRLLAAQMREQREQPGPASRAPAFHRARPALPRLPRPRRRRSPRCRRARSPRADRRTRRRAPRGRRPRCLARRTDRDRRDRSAPSRRDRRPAATSWGGRRGGAIGRGRR